MFDLMGLGELSKVGVTLVERVSEAIGWYSRPSQIERIAQAEAKAALIKAKNEIEITDLHRRATSRLLEEEAKRQENIENITQRAIPLLTDGATPEKLEDDWLVNFFDKCRTVSDVEMQALWAEVLVGKANNPGSFSRKTINLLSDLGKEDAELFKRFCGYTWRIGDLAPLIFELENNLYKKNNIDFSSLIRLDSLGLIRFDTVAGFLKLFENSSSPILYYGRSVELTFPENSKKQLEVGNVLFTPAGQELAAICGGSPVEGFFEFVTEKFASQGLIPPQPDKEVAGTAS